jgi:ferredoxin
MKVSVSPDLCCGAQLCAKVAPDFYRLEDGFNALVNVDEVEVPEEHRKAAVRGARSCPESAIRVTDDDGTVLAPVGAG